MTAREFYFQNLSKMSKHQDRDSSHTSYLPQYSLTLSFNVIFSNERNKCPNNLQSLELGKCLCDLYHIVYNSAFWLLGARKDRYKEYKWGWSLNVDTCQLLNLFSILLFFAQGVFPFVCTATIIFKITQPLQPQYFWNFGLWHYA